MDHYDHLFGDSIAQDENEGEILSDGEIPADGDNDGDGNDDGSGGGAPKAVKLEVKKKTVQNPRNMLNATKLCGPRGIIGLREHFKDFKFHGKGHEVTDLNSMMHRYEHWAHRLYPKYHFDDCLATIENLGNKKEVQMYMNKYRVGLLQQELEQADAVRSEEDTDQENGIEMHRLDQPLDPLDSMLDEQIAISRGRTLLGNTSGVADLSMDTTFDAIRNQEDAPRSSNTQDMADAPDSSGKDLSSKISDELRAKIEANRKRALELRQAKLLALSQDASGSQQRENDDNNGSLLV